MIHQMLHHLGHISGAQGTAQPCGAQIPATRLLDKMDVVTETTCLSESRGRGSGLQHAQRWTQCAGDKETG